MACTTDVLDGIAEVVVQSLVSDEVPNFNLSTSIIFGADDGVVVLGQCFRRLFRVLVMQKL